MISPRLDPEMVVIVSDGFENDPPLGAAEVVRVYRERLDRGGKTLMVHLNPVFDTWSYCVRGLSPAIPAMGLRDAEDLLTMLGFARFASGRSPLADLEEYLAGRVRAYLESGESPEHRAEEPVSPPELELTSVAGAAQALLEEL